MEVSYKVTRKPKLAKLVYLTVLCLFSCILFSMSLSVAQETTTVPLKDWHEYTDREIDILRNRWTPEKVEAVIIGLGAGKLPEFVAQLPRLYLLCYDLRGIQLENHNLDSLYLGSTYLQGADLSSANLQGADLSFADLQGADLRSAKLQGADLNHTELRGALLSVADLQEADLSGADLQYTEMEGVKLQGAYLTEAKLQGAWLPGADLQGAHLVSADLQGADLPRAKLQGADLRWTNLQDADLYEAELQGAYLSNAKLQDAYLSEADLQGANLQGANLQEADLYTARFDSTYLWLVNLGSAKNIRYIIWGDSLKSRYFIGEEIKADSTKTYEDFRKTEITYRDLKTLYKRELMDNVGAEFHYRENEVKTKASPWLIRQIRLLFLKWTYGYGSRPTWLLWYSLVVIGLFALIFSIFTIPRKTKSGIYLVKAGESEKEELLPFHKGRLFLDCLYFSTLSFATFGYGALQPRQWLQFFRLEPVEYKPVRWARIFVGIEAALGIWIFALLVTVLFGR